MEVVVELDDGRLLIGNDNNYPGSDGRVPGTPDDTEMIVIDLGRRQHGRRRTTTTSSSATAAPAATGPSTRSPPTSWPSCSAPTSSSPTSSPPRTACSSPATRTRSAAPPTSPSHPEFADRRTTKTIDGVAITGWFTEDFTLAELRTLRAIERIPATRPANTAFNGRYRVPTFEEVVDLARHSRTCDGAPVGVYPETKHPTYFDSIGLSLEEALVEVLESNGFRGRRAPAVSSRASRPATCASSTR